MMLVPYTVALLRRASDRGKSGRWAEVEINFPFTADSAFFPLPGGSLQLPIALIYILLPPAKHSSFSSSPPPFSCLLSQPSSYPTISLSLSRRLSQLVCPVPFLQSRCSPTLVTWAHTQHGIRHPQSDCSVRRSINLPPGTRA